MLWQVECRWYLLLLRCLAQWPLGYLGASRKGQFASWLQSRSSARHGWSTLLLQPVTGSLRQSPVRDRRATACGAAALRLQVAAVHSIPRRNFGRRNSFLARRAIGSLRQLPRF